MLDGIELVFHLVKLKSASTRLNELATSLDNNKLEYTFDKSKGETADKMMELVAKYNELGASLAQLVWDVKASTDMTREGVKNADDQLASCWQSIVSTIRKV